MKKVLIVGASGFVGSNLARHLSKNYQVFGTYQVHRPYINHVPFLPLRIQAETSVEILLERVKPDWIIYAAEISAQKQLTKNPQNARVVNAEFPCRLADYCHRNKFRFLFLSSPEVFNGNESSGYFEDDAQYPCTQLGILKSLAEKHISQYPLATVLRFGTPVGIGNFYHRGPFSEVLRRLKQRKAFSAITGNKEDFISMKYFCESVSSLLRASDLPKRIHLSAAAPHTFLDFIQTVAQVFGYSADQVTPIKEKNTAARTLHLKSHWQLIHPDRPLIESILHLKTVLQSGAQ